MREKTVLELQNQVTEYYAKAKIVIMMEECKNLEVVDFGLNDVYVTGLRALCM